MEIRNLEQLLCSSILELNVKSNGDVFLSSLETDDPYLGHVNDDASFSLPSEWDEYDTDEFVCIVQEAIQSQIAKATAAWRWDEYPSSVIRFAFTERSPIWQDVLVSIAEAIHLHLDSAADFLDAERLADLVDQDPLWRDAWDALAPWGQRELSWQDLDSSQQKEIIKAIKEEGFDNLLKPPKV